MNNKNLYSKQEKILADYYTNIGYLNKDAYNKDLKKYITTFLRERFLERIIFTVLVESDIRTLFTSNILIIGEGPEFSYTLIKWGANPGNITIGDIYEPALQRARDLCPINTKFTKINFSKIDIEDETIDIIFCFNYLSNILIDEAILDIAGESQRILKKNGLAFFQFMNDCAANSDIYLSKYVRTFRNDEILSLFSSFKLISLLSFIPYNPIQFTLDDEAVFPKHIGRIEDILISDNKRFTNSLLVLTK